MHLIPHAARRSPFCCRWFPSAIILVVGPRMGKDGLVRRLRGHRRRSSRRRCCRWSRSAIWLAEHPPVEAAHHGEQAARMSRATDGHAAAAITEPIRPRPVTNAATDERGTMHADGRSVPANIDGGAAMCDGTWHACRAKPHITGDWYTLGDFGKLQTDDRLLHRRADDRHVLHGDADCVVHSLLRDGLHARRAA